MSIKVLLVDDHPIVRQGIRSLLESEAKYHIVGECASGTQALRLVQEHQPHILILDLEIEGLKGIEVLREVRQLSPKTHVIILSMYQNEEYVIEAIRHGACAYVLKGSEKNHLLSAITNALQGRRYLSPPLTEEAIQKYLSRIQSEYLDPFETLTNRERQILQLSAAGCTSAQIADELAISPRTVETHRQNMMRKLKLQNQTELVLYAVRKGIISLK